MVLENVKLDKDSYTLKELDYLAIEHIPDIQKYCNFFKELYKRFGRKEEISKIEALKLFKDFNIVFQGGFYG